MLKPYDLLDNVLLDIESGIKEKLDPGGLAKRFSLSEGHLRRLFKFAFNLSLSKYIRLRRLALSLDDLLNTDSNVIDIALLYGFEYEQSYIRSFKQEFGITPGELRKTKQIVKVKPPLHLFDENKLDDGLLFGPDIVMVPQFQVIGKLNSIPYHDTFIALKAAINFWENEKHLIKNPVNSDVYIGITRDGFDNDLSNYLTSIQVTSTNFVPEGLCTDTFETSLCARFRYIGQHHYYNINRIVAKSMYSAIQNFANDKRSKYALARDKVYFEKIDTEAYDGTYCQMEWYAPVVEKD